MLDSPDTMHPDEPRHLVGIRMVAADEYGPATIHPQCPCSWGGTPRIVYRGEQGIEAIKFALEEAGDHGIRPDLDPAAVQLALLGPDPRDEVVDVELDASALTYLEGPGGPANPHRSLWGRIKEMFR